MAALAEQRSRFLAEIARTRSVIVELGTVLGQLGVVWVVLKGPALAYTVYPRPDLRSFVDLDVLQTTC